MTTYKTGNPIGSKDPRDLYDNAENLDTAVNDTSRDTWSDRLGRSRKTMSGMEREFNADQDDRDARFNADQSRRESEFNADQDDRDARFNADQSRRESEFDAAQDSRQAQFAQLMISGGYEFLGDYAADIEVTTYKQVIKEGSEFWRPAADTVLPYTTTGAGMPEGGAFVNIGDGLLRQDLVQPVATFNNVQDMKGSAGLDVGRKVRTLGYYAPGDGGGNDYEIVAAGTGTDDGGSFIDLAGSGLQAKGLFINGVFIEHFGFDETSFVKAIEFSAYSGRVLSNLTNHTYEMTDTITVPAGLVGKFNKLNISYSPGFAGYNGFHVKDGNVSLSGINIDGSNLPRRDEIPESTEGFPVGTHFILDADPEIIYDEKSAANTPKRSGFSLTDSTLKNQPGGYIAASNFDDVVVSNCRFETLADSDSTIQNGIVPRWAGEEGTRSSNWKVQNNHFRMLVENGVGNVKLVSSNGVRNFVITGNTLERVHLGGDQGTVGLAEAVFLKRAIGASVVGNTVRAVGTFVKCEQDSESVVITGNNVHDALENVFMVQGARGVEINSNTIVRTAGRVFYVGSHGPSATGLRDCLISDNLIMDPFSLNTESIPSNTRAVFFIAASSGLSASNIVISGNVIRTDLSLSGQQVPSSAITIYSYSGGVIEGVRFLQNTMHGIFSSAIVRIAANVKNVSIVGNEADFEGFYSIRNQSVDTGGSTVENLLIEGNRFNLLGGANGHIYLTEDGGARIAGLLSITGNKLLGNFVSSNIIIGTSPNNPDVAGFSDLNALLIEGNVLEGDSTVYIRRSVVAKEFNLSRNRFLSEGGTYCLTAIGANSPTAFETVTIQGNTCQGRARFILDAQTPLSSTVVFEGNSSANRVVDSAGISFTDGALSNVVGYVGLNQVNASDARVAHFGTLPPGVFTFPIN